MDQLTSGSSKDQNAGVWPPPPSNAFSPIVWFPFRSLNLRVEGKPSAFQRGRINMEAAGITICGKNAMRYAGLILYWPVYLMYFIRHWLPAFLRLPSVLAVLAAAVICLVFLFMYRKSATLIVPWSQVRQIVHDTKKRRVGIVYEAPDAASTMKTYSLVFALSAVLYPSFLAISEQVAPHRWHQDKLRDESITVFLMLGLHIIVVLAVAFFLSKIIMGH